MGTAACNVASILLMTKLRQGAPNSHPRVRGWAEIRTDVDSRGLFCHFPTGLGRPLGGWGAPAARPLQPPGQPGPGRPPGCRAPRPPASRRCESPRAPAPPPAPTNSALPGNCRRFRARSALEDTGSSLQPGENCERLRDPVALLRLGIQIRSTVLVDTEMRAKELVVHWQRDWG